MQNEKLSQLTSFIGTVYTVAQQYVKGLVYLLWRYGSGSLDTDGSGFRESPCNMHYSLWHDG